MDAPEMAEIANLIARVLSEPDSAENIAAVRTDVATLCKKFPVYG